MKAYFYLAAIVAASVLASCHSSSRTYTEERVVYTRPAPPVAYSRPAPPSQGYVWVDGEYIWRNGRYEYTNGYWIAPKGNQRMYVKGYWAHRRNGYVWIPGHWR